MTAQEYAERKKKAGTQVQGDNAQVPAAQPATSQTPTSNDLKPVQGGKTIQGEDSPSVSAADQDAARRARLMSDTAVQEAGPVDTSFAQGAQEGMAGYDQYTKAGMGATPQETMQLADAAARQTAQAESDAAIRAAVKGGRTGGATGGQAALAATGQAASAYGTGMQRGTQQYFDTTKFGAQLGSEMSGRLQTASQLKAQQDAANLAARTASMQARTGSESQALGGQTSAASARETANIGAKSAKETANISAAASKYAADQQAKAAAAQRKSSAFGSILGAAGGVLGAFSDEKLKENIDPASMTEGLEKVPSYNYNYKGSDRPESGVMAQDLERTNMKPAVMDTPKGKFVNTQKLSLMNTGAIADQERRVKDIERLLKGLEEIGRVKK